MATSATRAISRAASRARIRCRSVIVFFEEHSDTARALPSLSSLSSADTEHSDTATRALPSLSSAEARSAWVAICLSSCATLIVGTSSGSTYVEPSDAFFMFVLDCSSRAAQLSQRTTRAGADTCVLRASAASWLSIMDWILFSAHAAHWSGVAPWSGMALPSRTSANSTSSHGVRTPRQRGTTASLWATPIASSRVTEAGARVGTATSGRGSVPAAEVLVPTFADGMDVDGPAGGTLGGWEIREDRGRASSPRGFSGVSAASVTFGGLLRHRRRFGRTIFCGIVTSAILGIDSLPLTAVCNLLSGLMGGQDLSVRGSLLLAAAVAAGL